MANVKFPTLISKRVISAVPDNRSTNVTELGVVSYLPRTRLAGEQTKLVIAG